MPRLLTVTSGVLLVTLLASCGSSSTAPSLDATSWSLTQVSGAAARPGGMLAFDAGKVSGSTGCNSFGGTYDQSGANLTITLGATTLIGCPPDLQTQEQQVLAGLKNTASFVIDGQTLTLRDSSGTSLLGYSRLEPASLIGPEWKVTGINNGKGAVASTLGGSTVTATFGSDGKVTGSAGCNTYSAGYTLEADAIHVDAPAATRKLCSTPPGVMEQETAFLAALEASTQVEVDGSGVTLRDPGGAIQLTLSGSG